MYIPNTQSSYKDYAKSADVLTQHLATDSVVRKCTKGVNRGVVNLQVLGTILLKRTTCSSVN